MSSNEPVLEHLPQYKVLVCTPCGYAIRNLNHHLRDHHTISKERRKEIIDLHSHLQLAKPDHVHNPSPNRPAMACLRKPVTGYSCTAKNCDFVCGSQSWFCQHGNSKHGWRGIQREQGYWQEVKVQTFFNSGGFTSYFVVQAEDGVDDEISNLEPRSHQSGQHLSRIISPTGTASQNLTAAQQEELDAVAQEWSSIQEQHEQMMQEVEGEQATHDRTGWWSFTKWAQHFSKCNMRHLAHASRVPDHDEPVLKEACRVVDLTLNRAVSGLATLHRETRRWLRSPKLSELDIRPLARLQEPNSQERYHNYWRRFICYCFRVWLSRQEDESIQEENSVQPASQRPQRSLHGRIGRYAIDVTGSAPISSQAVASDSGSDSDNPAAETPTDSGDDTDDDHSSSDSETASANKPKEVDVMKDARRLFVWSGRQLELMANLYAQVTTSEGVVDDESRVETMLELCQSFIFSKFTASEFTCGLVHFCAVLGIDGENNRLRRPADFTYALAGLVYDARILAAEILLPSSRREEQSQDLSRREHFLKQRATYLADGTSTPMSTMISLLAYGKHIAMNEGNAGTVSWSENRQILYYKGLPIEMILFRSMVQDAIHRTTEMLWRDLMWILDEGERFEVPLGQIHDDVSFTRRGWSFMTRKEHGLINGDRWMRERLVQLEGPDRLRSDGVWRPRACRRYLRQCDQFLELLLFCIHTTWGQPARGTEILSTRFQNGVFQDRNVFVIDARGVIVTRYHKSQALLDRPKVIPRWPAEQVFQLLVIWLAYPRTLRDHLKVQLDKQTISDYIWSDNKGPWDTSRLTKVLQRETVKALGYSFGTLDYRHIAVSIGREVVGDTFARGYKDDTGEIEEPEADDEDALEVQAGRGDTMGRLRYGVPINIVNQLSVRSLQVFRPLSKMWHHFLGLCSSSEDQELLEIRPTRSSTPTKRIARSQHEEAEQRGRSRSRHLEPRWRRSFVDSSPAIPESSSLRSTCRDTRRPSSASPNLDEDEEAVMSGLQKLLKDPSAQFHSDEQSAAAFAVLRGDTPLIVVLPTGGGKTLLAALPAVLEPKDMSIFVAPFRALVDDIVQRFQSDGIDAIEWCHGDSNPASVVVVSADIAGDYEFLSYAQKMRQSGLLRRIFIDECHLTFTSSDWRPKLAKLRHLRVITCPIILLTATLPPLQVFELETAMEVRTARIIRSSTARLHHRYAVQRCAAGKLQAQAVDICRRQLRHMKAGTKGIVYALSRSLCEDLAAELQCPHYHAGVVDRSEHLQRWLRDGGLVVATSALGTGVSFSGIVFVLHVDLPWSMIDFAQESGRAGRDGETVRTTILVPERSVEAKIQSGELSLDRSAIAQFVTTKRCRRQVMSDYLDGPEFAAVCEDLVGCERCDCCAEGVAEVQTSNRQHSEDWERVKGNLDSLVGNCTLCWAQLNDSEQSWREHNLHQCPRRWARQSVQDLDRFRYRISYQKKSHTCHRCGISQRYCDTKDNSRNACQWPNIVVPILAAMLNSGDVNDPIQQRRINILRELGYHGGINDAAFARWVGQKHVRPVLGTWMSNGMVVVIRVLLRHNQ